VGIGSETFLPDVELLNVLAPTYALINERVSTVVTPAKPSAARGQNHHQYRRTGRAPRVPKT